MGNMSYCRFENTSADIEDCIEAFIDNNWDIEKMIKNSNREEAGSMIRFINQCLDVADMFQEDDFDEQELETLIRNM